MAWMLCRLFKGVKRNNHNEKTEHSVAEEKTASTTVEYPARSVLSHGQVILDTFPYSRKSSNSRDLSIPSPIFLKPLILRARRARKIKGFRKIGEGIALNLLLTF